MFLKVEVFYKFTTLELNDAPMKNQKGFCFATKTGKKDEFLTFIHVFSIMCLQMLKFCLNIIILYILLIDK